LTTTVSGDCTARADCGMKVSNETATENTVNIEKMRGRAGDLLIRVGPPDRASGRTPLRGWLAVCWWFGSPTIPLVGCPAYGRRAISSRPPATLRAPISNL
jgi:hypothetical protein